VATASGRPLGEKRHLMMRERELAGVLKEYKGLPESERRPKLPDPAKATPPRRPVPKPPPGGLILRAYCTYLDREEGKIGRAKVYYYAKNPDRWAAETQSDMLWLTGAEKKSLIPADPRVGQRVEVAGSIQKRFFSTVAIDFMHGSVESLPPRETTLTLTVERITDGAIEMRLDGHGSMGKPFDEKARGRPDSRGCEVRVAGRVKIDRATGAFERIDVVGVGRAWGNNASYLNHPASPDSHPWLYGIACELVKGDAPKDRLPPYNLLHYNATKPYFPPEPSGGGSSH
jgi:hypothetical protein